MNWARRLELWRGLNFVRWECLYFLTRYSTWAAPAWRLLSPSLLCSPSPHYLLTYFSNPSPIYQVFPFYSRSFIHIYIPLHNMKGLSPEEQIEVAVSKGLSQDRSDTNSKPSKKPWLKNQWAALRVMWIFGERTARRRVWAGDCLLFFGDFVPLMPAPCGRSLYSMLIYFDYGVLWFQLLDFVTRPFPRQSTWSLTGAILHFLSSLAIISVLL
jgi:hypothetical protein